MSFPKKEINTIFEIEVFYHGNKYEKRILQSQDFDLIFLDIELKKLVSDIDFLIKLLIYDKGKDHNTFYKTIREGEQDF